MGTSVSVYVSSVPTFDFEQLVFDESTRVSLPINLDERARWCREFAAVLVAEAERSEQRHAEGLAAIAAVQAEVDRLRAERTEAGGHL